MEHKPLRYLVSLENIILNPCISFREGYFGWMQVKEQFFHRGKYHCFTSLDSTTSLHTNNHILVKSNLVKLETSHTLVLPPTVSFLWFFA